MLRDFVLIAMVATVVHGQPLTNKGGEPCPGFDNFKRGTWLLDRRGFDYKDTYQLRNTAKMILMS